MKLIHSQALSCGNATRLTIRPTRGESRWRVLRKGANEFSGWDDPSAMLISDASELQVTDAFALTNGVTYWYAIYGFLNGVWDSEPVAVGLAPEASFSDETPDAQEMVRSRLDATLNAMIARGALPVGTPQLQVLSIPFYTQGGNLPVVTVLYEGGGQTERAIGDQIDPGAYDLDASWVGQQGWIQSVRLSITAWSLNAQERNVLRRGIGAAIAANLTLLEDLGLMMFEVQSVQDVEDTQSMNAPVYQTTYMVGCQVISSVATVDKVFLEFDVNNLEEVRNG